MSKLEKALEMARQVRGIEAGQTSDNAEDEQSSGPSDEERQTSRIPPRGTIDPFYSQTRVAHTDVSTLESYGILTPEFHPAVIEQYNLLRIKIISLMSEKDARSLLVASPGPDEGKTVTAVNLAISIARETSRTVLLVDADMRKPAICHYLGLEESPGLYEHLTRGVPLNRLLINPGIPRLILLQAGKPGDYPPDILGGPAMEDFINDIRERYPERIIIFDTPPLNMFSDSLYLKKYIDGVLMVVRSRVTTEENLRSAMDELGDTPLLGVVLNRVLEEQCPSYSYYKEYMK